MKHYPHHIGDFDKATRHLTRIERSIYRDMLDLYYDTESQLPLDQTWICRKIIARSNEESTAVEQMLNEFFTETPTGWFHERCEEVIADYRANTSQKSGAGKASAAAKALRKQQALNGQPTGVPTAVQQPLNSVDTADNGESTNQKPETINHKPREKKTAKVSTFTPPDWINAVHWATWHSCAKRKKATDEQKQLAVEKLDAWRQKGLDHAGALENAAMGGYQGLFLPEQGGFAHNPAKQPVESFAERDERRARERIAEATGTAVKQPTDMGMVIDITPQRISA